MLSPSEYDSKEKFIRDCVRKKKKEGKDPKKAAKQCVAMWSDSKKRR